jgi:hypothetical protein
VYHRTPKRPPVYRAGPRLPAGSAITEFPFGDAGWEIRYVYYAAAHWKPITNGYSGNFPAEIQRASRAHAAHRDRSRGAWTSLKDSAQRMSSSPKRVRERRGC